MVRICHCRVVKNLHIQNSTEILSKSGNEAPTNNTEKNKTERNKTERNKTEDSIYPIYPTKEKGAMDVTEVYRRIVKENISYESAVQQSGPSCKGGCG